jgi:hypothetical protein
MSQPSRPLLGQWLPQALIVLGALLTIGAIFADEIGFSGGGDGFGWKQLIAVIVGIIIALFGVSLWFRPTSQTADIRRQTPAGVRRESTDTEV